MARIIAKAVSDSDITLRKFLNTDGIEWQLYEDNSIITNLFTLPIYNIHTTLSNQTPINFSEAFPNSFSLIGDYKYVREQIENAFILAENVAQIQAHQVNVIVHEVNTGLPASDNEMELYLISLFTKYPNCNLCIENAMSYEDKLRQFYSAADANSIPYLVKYLRGLLSSYNYDKKIYSVLDICHAMSSIRMANTLSKDNTNEMNELKKYFQMFKSTCKIVHFNWLNDLGFNTNHGISFSDTAFIDVYQMFLDYVPDALCVIEMREDNYDKPLNLIKTIAQIKNR